MDKVTHHWFCFLQDEDGMHSVREVYLTENNRIHYRSNDMDLETRYYQSSVSDFEYKFKVNIVDEMNK
jgi:hypothetical protein